MSQQIFGNHIAAKPASGKIKSPNQIGLARYRSGDDKYYPKNIADFVVEENFVDSFLDLISTPK